jgi:predicted 3-demethylubiquinone-9 3-methyltransferase (glyoxalase superfamily)
MTTIQKITPHLWFDTQAREAAGFYTSIFKDSEIKTVTTLSNTPSGAVDVLTIMLMGQEFMLISAGPLFKFNPSVSFLVACATRDEIDAMWEGLSSGGTALMELGAYQFSRRYGWVQDRYGLSWQIMFTEGRPIEQNITPVLMFAGQARGKAREAIDFYTSTFRNTRIGDIARYSRDAAPDPEGSIQFASFALEGQWFAAMDSARAHDAAFNEAISFMVNCDDQAELDDYWRNLSAVPEAEQCGWLKDKFGLSWQIVPAVMNEMLTDPDRSRVERVTAAFLEMRKLDIARLKEAYA